MSRDEDVPPPPSGFRTLNELAAPRLLVRAGRLLAQRWQVLVGAAALTLVPVALLQAYLLRDVADPLATAAAPDDPQAAAVFGVFGAAYLVIITPLLAAVVLRAEAAHHAGRTPGVDELYSYGLSRLPVMVGITLLSGLAAGIGFLAFIIPGVYIFVRLYLALPVAVVEGTGLIDSLRRSWDLTGDAFWRIMAVAVLALVGMFLVTLASQELLGLVARTAGWAVAGALDGLVSALVLPFGFVVGMLVYLDARGRRDGLTPEALGGQLGQDRT